MPALAAAAAVLAFALACQSQAHEKRAAVVDEIPLKLGEASGVAVLPGGRGFLVVDDERGLIVAEPAKTSAPWASRVVVPSSSSSDLKDLEGITLAGDQVLVIGEKSGIVSAFDVDALLAASAPPPHKVLGTVPQPPSPKSEANKGFEGIAFLPAALASDKRAHLILAHQAKPKALVVLTWPSLAPEATLVVDASTNAPLDHALGGLSDIAVDPKNGDLLIVSAKSARLVRARLAFAAAAPPTMTLAAQVELPFVDEKAEGVAVAADGDLWITTDKTGRLAKVHP